MLNNNKIRELLLLFTFFSAVSATNSKENQTSETLLCLFIAIALLSYVFRASIKKLFFESSSTHSDTETKDEDTDLFAGVERQRQLTVESDINPVETKEGLKHLCRGYIKSRIRLIYKVDEMKIDNYDEYQKTLTEETNQMEGYFREYNDIELLRVYTINACNTYYGEQKKLLFNQKLRRQEEREELREIYGHGFRPYGFRPI